MKLACFNEAGATIAPETRRRRKWARNDGTGFNEAGATIAPETEYRGGPDRNRPRASMRPGQQSPRKPRSATTTGQSK